MKSNCPKKNPCNCIGQPVIVVDPPPPCPSGCCLRYCDTIIAPKNAVGPCGQVGLFDLKMVKAETDCCKNAPKLSIVSFDKEHFVSAVLKDDNQLEWVTRGADRLHKFGQVRIKACCETEDGQVLSTIFCVIIGIKDLCACPECKECDDCDPCTGECKEADVLLEASNVSTNSQIEVNVL